MRIGLIGPVEIGCENNPGWHMITDGIRYLVRRAAQDAQFVLIDMLRDNATHWNAAATCDAVIMCGNPRFSVSPDQWWVAGIWQRLAQLQIAGVRVIDGWAGSAVELLPSRDIEQMAAMLFEAPRNSSYLALARLLTGRITRDAVMQRLYERAGAASVLLPCSSWYAANWHHVESEFKGDVDAIVLFAIPGYEWLPEYLRAQQASMAAERLCIFIASTWDDYLWARGVGLDDVVLLPDSESLLRFYARCKRVLTFRIHAAIPAASLGCEVGVVAIDSRVLTCDQFELPKISLTDLLAREPEFACGRAPDEQACVETLKGMLQ